MALLGAQLVITLVTVSIMQKLGIYFSFARWLLCGTGLIRYLYPTNAQLKELMKEKEGGVTPSGKSGGSRRRMHNNENGSTQQTFHVPRNIELELESCKVDRGDVVHLRYYTDYQWLIDFSLYSILVYTCTELYQNWFPIVDEMNLSMMWCMLVIIFATRVLMMLTVQYFRGEESIGERSMCIVMGFVYLLIAMMVLIVDERNLELHLEDAYTSFNRTATKLLTEHTNSWLSQGSGPASKLVLKFFMALWCALIGTLFTFPGLRVAKMHRDLLSNRFKDNKMAKLLLNVWMAMPFVAVCFWVRPITRDYLTVRIFSGMTKPLIEGAQFETIRLVIVIVICLIHICLLPTYLQSYLEMAKARVERMRKEAGRILNTDLQSGIAAVYYYVCAVALQYTAPVILCLFFTLMLKCLGEYTWTGEEAECPLSTEPAADDMLGLLRNVFGAEVMRGLLNFSLWWSLFAWFATLSVGLVYQSYFAKAL